MKPGDFSDWCEKLKDVALCLLSSEDVFKCEGDKSCFKRGTLPKDYQAKLRFRALAATGLELLVKCACLARRIDIFLPSRTGLFDTPPYTSALTAGEEPWLSSMFALYRYQVVSDLNTKSLYKCLEILEADIKRRPLNDLGEDRKLLRSLQLIRDFQRSIILRLDDKPLAWAELDDILGAANELLAIVSTGAAKNPA